MQVTTSTAGTGTAAVAVNAAARMGTWDHSDGAGPRLVSRRAKVALKRTTSLRQG